MDRVQCSAVHIVVVHCRSQGRPRRKRVRVSVYSMSFPLFGQTIVNMIDYSTPGPTKMKGRGHVKKNKEKKKGFIFLQSASSRRKICPQKESVYPVF